MFSIEVKHLSKVINNKTVLDDINVCLEEGKIYGVYGYNGCGKTMFFKALSGLIKPTTGEIKIHGQELNTEAYSPTILGFLIENHEFKNSFTGFENLKIISSKKEIIKDCDIKNALNRIGFDPNNKMKYEEYSLGMKQRLGIAKAIMGEPNILILDDPTSGLDKNGIKLIYKILIEEKQKGTTILIATHNEVDINLLSDVILEMDNGKFF